MNNQSEQLIAYLRYADDSPLVLLSFLALGFVLGRPLDAVVVSSLIGTLTYTSITLYVHEPEENIDDF